MCSTKYEVSNEYTLMRIIITPDLISQFKLKKKELADSITSYKYSTRILFSTENVYQLLNYESFTKNMRIGNNY